MIPVTILITAFANIFEKETIYSQKAYYLRYGMALFFGLIHGLGFSGYFKMLIGSTEDKLIPLLEFALGIEVAQLIIVFIILLLTCSYLQGFYFHLYLQFLAEYCSTQVL